ncbi:MAG: hypothetical protein JKY34_04860 [Kordiimonadaceae bacterium]|nr:hypothetical protein [Kordiimonadaceae bacterium]
MGEIARSIDKPPATVFSYLQYHGGIRPRKRVRASVTLTFGERGESGWEKHQHSGICLVSSDGQVT